MARKIFQAEKFYRLKYETPPIWRARFPYFYPWRTGWPTCTPRHWVPLKSPSSTRRAVQGRSRWSSLYNLGIYRVGNTASKNSSIVARRVKRLLPNDDLFFLRRSFFIVCCGNVFIGSCLAIAASTLSSIPAFSHRVTKFTRKDSGTRGCVMQSSSSNFGWNRTREVNTFLRLLCSWHSEISLAKHFS
jgi:hypothetical protein